MSVPQGEGRACRRLLAMLRERGYGSLDFWVISQGANRNGRDGMGCAKWGVYLRGAPENPRRVYLFSLDRITDCVRYGFDIGSHEVHGAEVSANASDRVGRRGRLTTAVKR